MKKYLFLLFLLSGCSILDESKTERRTVTIACNKGSIQSYLNDGWTVENSNTRQVRCGISTKQVCVRRDAVQGWCTASENKSVDVIGTEVEYIISRKSKEKRQWVKGISSIPKKAVDAGVGLYYFIDNLISDPQHYDRPFNPESTYPLYRHLHYYVNKRNAIKDAKKYNCYNSNGTLDIHKYRSERTGRKGWQICRTIWQK